MLAREERYFDSVLGRPLRVAAVTTTVVRHANFEACCRVELPSNRMSRWRADVTYRICAQCVMDSTDPLIHFDSAGACSYCREYRTVRSKDWHRGELGAAGLQRLLHNLRKCGSKRQYDAVLGLSGGIDSSYLALKSKEWGLRLLIVHVDGGWNSQAAVSNIERLVDYCGYDLFTFVVDWTEMRDVQLAYLKSGVTNQDVPQDHAFFSALFRCAIEIGVPTILSGGNVATEGISPQWIFDPLDVRNLEAIHRQYGGRPLSAFPRISFVQRYIWYPAVRGLRVFRPLNYIEYRKDHAVEELKGKIGWTDYGRKHGESRFTKFFQNYYLPNRGYDKRRPHLSSLIVSGQMSRAQALEMLSEPLYQPEELRHEFEYISNKLGVTVAELSRLSALPARDHRDFPNQQSLQRFKNQAQRWARRVLSRELRAYS